MNKEIANTVYTQEEKLLMIKPLRKYESVTNSTDIKKGDIIFAKLVKFIEPDLIIFEFANQKATMNIEDYDIFDIWQNQKSVWSNKGKIFKLRVKEICDDGSIVLERKSVILETTKTLIKNKDKVIEATVEKISTSGLFVDIGDGIISFLYSTSLTCSRFKGDYNIFFKKGDIIKVKIIDYDYEKNFFELSRKNAYEKLDSKKLPRESVIVVTCIEKVITNNVVTGIFIEYNPNNIGIMDLPVGKDEKEFYSGRKVSVGIRKVTDKGFKATFIRFTDPVCEKKFEEIDCCNDIIKKGDVVLANICEFISPDNIVLKIGEKKAKMNVENFNIYDTEKNKKSVFYMVGENVLARVLSVSNDVIELERKSLIKETESQLKNQIGNVVDATISSVSDSNLFVEIGNGYISALKFSNISKLYYPISNYKIGDCVKVKIIDYDINNNQFYISRKEAYETLNEYIMPIGSRILVTCSKYTKKIYEDDIFYNGIVAEYNPGNIGLVKIPWNISIAEFKNKRKMYVTIKKYKNKKFIADFNCFV